MCTFLLHTCVAKVYTSTTLHAYVQRAILYIPFKGEITEAIKLIILFLLYVINQYHLNTNPGVHIFHFQKYEE